MVQKSSRSCISPYFLGLLDSFQNMLPERYYMSPSYLTLLNSFEEKLELSFNKLISETSNHDILSLSWITLALKSLCQTLDDITSLTIHLGISVFDLDQEATHIYLDNKIHLLGMYTTFNDEIVRLSKLTHSLQNVIPNTTHIHHSISEWKQQTHDWDPKMDNWILMTKSYIESLKLPSVIIPTKGNVLMRAIYGLKMKTLLISRVFTSAFFYSNNHDMFYITDITLPWADTFTSLQLLIDSEIVYQSMKHGGNPGFKELQAITYTLKICKDQNTPEVVESTVSDIKEAAEKFCDAVELVLPKIEKFTNKFMFSLVESAHCLEAKYLNGFPRKLRLCEIITLKTASIFKVVQFKQGNKQSLTCIPT